MCYEPRDAQKGNAARSIFYHATCYNMQNNLNWGIAANQDQATLKTWHFTDLPDSYEIARQEYIFSVQGNRNPYIDSVNFACHVNFDNMSYLETSCNVGIEEQLAANLSVFPVPSNGNVYAQVNGLTITAFTITDLSGRIVKASKGINEDVLIVNGNDLKSGKYLIEVSTPFGNTRGSFIKE
jgi:hypothetical protein